jgi:hypothetical protein
MESDDMQKAWEQYDENLAKNLRLDEDKLRKASLEKTEDQMEYPYTSEWVELVGGAIVATAVFILSVRQIAEPKFFWVGMLTVIIGIIYMRFSYVKIGFLKQIDYYGMPIVKLQGKVAHVKRKILKFRKIGMWLFPFYGLPIIPLTYKTLYHVDLFAHMKMLASKGIGFLIITYLAIFLINKYMYDKRFAKVEEQIERLKKFEKE